MRNSFGTLKRDLDARVGEELRRVRWSRSLVVFGAELVTKRESDFHGRLPNPEELERSIIKSSQAPISLGRETVTTGESTTRGAETVKF
jgi:hypothetical protein